MKHFISIAAIVSVSISCVQLAKDFTLTESAEELSHEDINTKSTTSVYFWYKNEKIYLSQVENTYFAIFNKGSNTDLEQLASSHSNDFELKEFNLEHYTDTCGQDEFMSAKITHELADEYSESIVYMAPYLTGYGGEIGITDRFYIKLKSENDITLLEAFAEQNGAEIIWRNFIPLWYTLVCGQSSSGNALELANKAYESGLFEMTDIEFMDDAEWSSSTYYNDTYYSTDQWNLHGTYGIDIENVHSITKGNPSVKVAIVDSGIQLNHPDLIVTESWDAQTRKSPGRLYFIDREAHPHGTAMTGIIGATTNNSIGIAGIAPEISLLPITMGASIQKDYVANGIYYAINSNADVISNSYGLGVAPQVEEAFLDALNHGCVIVQSSGNNNNTYPVYPYASIPEVIVVGNMTSDGLRYVDPTNTYVGSKYGEFLDVVAPGTNIKTLNAKSSYMSCTGTSPAAPHVAATAALILSVNPALTRQQVSEIIDKTARKLPEYTFSETEGRPNGTWNEEVGYGLINAMDAVSLAKGYYNLISFDYTGSTVEFSVTADKDIAIIWDWETEDITEVPLTSSTTRTFTHTYGTNKKRRIYIAEKIDLETDPIPVNSTALTEFVLTSGEDASDVEVKPRNIDLEYIRIVGGADIASQTVSIKDLPSLKDLYLVHMPDVAVEIRNCPELLRFGSSNYIWGGPPELSNPDLPMFPVEGELLGPDNVNGGTAGAVWPDVPEPVQSFSSLSIEGCDSLKDVSLENVGITRFDFSGLPSLRYLYVSSQDDMIVGGTDSICTLPDRSGQSTKGRIRVRGVSQTNTEYVNAVISVQNRNLISTFCSDKNWNVIWDSGVTDSAL